MSEKCAAPIFPDSQRFVMASGSFIQSKTLCMSSTTTSFPVFRRMLAMQLFTTVGACCSPCSQIVKTRSGSGSGASESGSTWAKSSLRGSRKRRKNLPLAALLLYPCSECESQNQFTIWASQMNLMADSRRFIGCRFMCRIGCN